ncbi:MAG: type II toxin-antitoxin system HicA family toxin [Terriglobales bacterium]
MPKLPRISGAETIRALKRLGFLEVRQRGSPVVLKRTTNTGEAGCVVPLHRELAIGTLRGILKQAGVTPQDSSRTFRSSFPPRAPFAALPLPS